MVARMLNEELADIYFAISKFTQIIIHIETEISEKQKLSPSLVV
jgi:hypothetical protein